MSPTRREFIQSLGIALASLVLTRCKSSSEGPIVETVEVEVTIVVEGGAQISCYVIETVEVEVPRATPTVGKKAQRIQRVRDCWLRLDWLAEQSQTGMEEANQAVEELTAEHRAALDELVSSSEMSEDVAHHVQLAFLAAVDHVVPLYLRVMCYEAVVVEPDATPTPTPQVDQAARQLVTDYAAGSGRRLTQQAELLTEMAGTSGIDPATVERAQSAIQRDMTLLSSTDHQDLIARLVEATRGTYDFPPVEELEMDIPPEVAEAARFLVELLLEE